MRANRNLVRSALAQGGVLQPMMIRASDSQGLGLCNPSVFIDNGEIWAILRNVNYTLYHCENEQTFNNRWGCLSYLNPEQDMHLRTWNFLCKLTPTLEIEKYWKIDTSALDKEPLWEFVGLEDARLVRWDGKLYGIGVRRDTTTNGQGRMELSELEVTDKAVKEVARFRIEHPTDPTWYCEKNWMPVLDMPFHFIQWTNPAVLVKADLSTLTSARAIEVDESDKIENLPFLRGSSQVIPWRGGYLCIVHDCDLFKNRQGQKDATYMHRFVAYDRSWHIVSIGPAFSFMDGEIEFCCGMAEWQGDLLITFGFQDNCAFILRLPGKMVPGLLGIEAFDWGRFSLDATSLGYISDEVFQRGVYELQHPVKAGDVVLDIGASVGPFLWSIQDKGAKRIVAVEPDARFVKTLRKNVLGVPNVEIVDKGIAHVDGKFLSYGLFSGKPFAGSMDEAPEPAEIDGIRFDTLLREKGIDHVDFLKIDCEGGEYDVFNDENFFWIKNNVRHVAGEFHLHTAELRAKWLHFRDTYLQAFADVAVYSLDGVALNSLWSEGFVEYYKAVMVYIDNPRKWASTQYPTLEVTTAVPQNGCPPHCAFCPQDELITAYQGDRFLSLENFKKIMDDLPREVQVTFAGYCEPFVNSDCAAMVRYAHETGHQVSMFTTGIGMSVDSFRQIQSIPFAGVQGGFVLHLPDEEGHFAHRITRQYMELLRAIKQRPPKNFRAVTMGTLAANLREMFPDAIRQTMYSRAGNVKRDGLVKIESKKGPTTCGCQERLYHGVLLPNGGVSLCCMDYGLKHILGNLFTDSYEEIVPFDGTPFELCQRCENGIPAIVNQESLVCANS